jgi:hypothetical protein
MRKFGFFILLAIALALFWACSAPTGPNIENSNTTTSGSIVVNFPNSNGQKGLINISKASTYSNYYELIAYNAANFYYINSNTSNKASSTGGTIANVSPGTYTIIALAGLATGDTITGATWGFSFTTAPNVVLLGSNSQTGVTVTAGNTTNVSLTLTNVLYNITCSGTEIGTTNTYSVPVSSNYTVTISGDTGSSMLVPISFAQSLWATTPSNLVQTSQAQAWTVTATFAAPSSAGSTVIEFNQSGVPVDILDTNTTGYAASNVKYICNLTGTYWNIAPIDSLPGYVSGGYDTKIAPGSVNVNFSIGGIAAGVTWGSGR